VTQARKAIRIGVLGLSHETNTFCLSPTTLANFESEGVLRGDAIWRVHASAHTILAGFATLLDRPDIELVPLFFTSAIPSGLITRDTYETLVGEVTDMVRSGGPWDGILMAQHGAAVAAGFPDADGEMISRVRAAVGPKTPIGVVLDLHANVSPLMVDASTVTLMTHRNPHTDMRDRGADCAALIVRTIHGEIRPVQALVQVPAVINITRQATAEPPMREIMADAAKVLDRPGILGICVAEGFPYADVAEMGMSCVVVADGDQDLARNTAQELGDRMWAARKEFLQLAMTPDEALKAADERGRSERRPALVLDVGDNIGGGGPGDNTVLLDALSRQEIGRTLVIITDREAVRACLAAGPGANVRLSVGGKLDNRFSSPVALNGTVRVLSDGKYEEPTPTHGGFRFFDAGTTAVVETDRGHVVVLTSRAVMPSSIEQIRSLGLATERFSILTAKGVISPRAGYEPVTCATFVADTPGVTAAGLSVLTYVDRPRPLFPFESDATGPSPALTLHA